MMKHNVRALALCLLMPALMMADDATTSNVCLSQQTTRGGLHFILGALTGAGQAYVANSFAKDFPRAADADKKLTEDGFKKLQLFNVLGAIAGGHVNDFVGTNAVNAVLLSQTDPSRTNGDKIAAALGQQAGNSILAKEKLVLAANPFDVLAVLSWLKVQAQAAQNYASDEVAQYQSTDDSKMMKRK